MLAHELLDELKTGKTYYEDTEVKVPPVFADEIKRHIEEDATLEEVDGAASHLIARGVPAEFAVEFEAAVGYELT